MLAAIIGLIGDLQLMVTAHAVDVDNYKTLELVFDQAVTTPANPLMKFVFGQSSIRAEVKIVQEKTHLSFGLVSIVPEETALC